MKEFESDFKCIYEENYARVMRICMGYASGDTELANDLVQEVFIKVWSNLNTFKGQSKITTWIYRIAVNTCLMNLRKNKTKPFTNVALQEDVRAEEQRSHEKERQYHEMYRCISMLSATNKAIIMMELEGLAQKEIAQIIGLQHEAIRTRIHRIKNQLSKCVDHG
ncbi:MAG: RNA polymerase sigma factor [Bacteroidota bacterium]